MSSLSKVPAWQSDRACRLHSAFQVIDLAMQYEGARLVKSLEALSTQLRGTTLKGGKELPSSTKALTTAWYKWIAGGKKAAALVPGYTSPKHVTAVPAELIQEIQRMASLAYGGQDKNGKGIDGTLLRKKLEERWHAGEALPGIGTWQEFWQNRYPTLPLPTAPPEFPWSTKTVLRKMGSKVIQTMGNIGIAAANRALPRLKRDYSKLRKCELYMLDDVRLDLVGIDELTGRVVTIICYVLMEVASRSIVAFVLKPKDAIRAEDVDELLAYGLQASGYGVGVGYQTHIWFERGTVACTEAAQRVLEAGSEGAIKVHRTGMDGGVRWVGAAKDKVSGHSAGKAAMEAFNKKLHALLKHLPGQRGNSRENQPANLGVGDKEVKDPSKTDRDSVRAQAEMLQQFKLTALVKGQQADLELPLLTVGKIQHAFAEAIKGYNHERGHGMQGFHTVTQAEVGPGVWQDVA